jgi:putative oxidoreductase
MTTISTTSTTISTSAASVTPAGTRRRRDIALRVVQILLAAFFVFVAVPKLTSQPVAVEAFAKIGVGQWLRYFVAGCEIAGALGLVIPRLTGVASIGLVALMIGATITNVFVAPATAPLTAVLGLLFAFIAWQRRTETKALLHTLKR